MANYTPSNLSTAQARLFGAMQNAEFRYSTPATFMKLKENSKLLFENYEQLRTREDRAITAYYKLRASATPGSAFSHDHTGSVGDSASLSLTWTAYTLNFVNSLKQGDNNIFGNQEQLDSAILNAVINMSNSHETAASDYLFNNRSGVNTAAVKGLFNSTNDVYEIAYADSETAIQISKIVMEVNKYGGMATIYCDSVSFADFQKQAAQGVSNSVNLSFQFAGVNFVHSLGLTANAATLGYTKGFWIIVPDGTVGVLPWIPKQNRLGLVTQVNKYGTLVNPITGLDYAIHSYETRADNSASNGYLQDVVTQYQLGIYLAFAKAPLSTADETTIQAFGIVDSITQ